MLYVRQSRMVRRLEDDWFGGSPPILTGASSRVLRHVRALRALGLLDALTEPEPKARETPTTSPAATLAASPAPPRFSDVSRSTGGNPEAASGSVNALSEGQVTTMRPLTPAAGPVCRPSLSVPAGAFQTTTENERATGLKSVQAGPAAQNGA